MEPKFIIIGIVIVLILVVVAYFILSGNGSNGNNESDKWMFYQGMDSHDYADIGNNKNLKGQIDALKAECDQLTNCIAFNTDGYFKSAVRSEADWQHKWNEDSRGLYVRN